MDTKNPPVQPPVSTPPPTPPTHHTPVLLLILSGLVLLGIGTAVGYVVASNLQTDSKCRDTKCGISITPHVTPTVIPSPTEIVDIPVEPLTEWKTYTNSTYKFQIQYPPSYESVTPPQTELARFQREGNMITVHAEKKPLKDITVSNLSGDTFHFDEIKKQWLDTSDQPTEYVTKLPGTLEAYSIGMADAGCASSRMIIPTPDKSSVIEVSNTNCGIERNNELVSNPYSLPQSDLIATFKFTN